MQSPKKIYGFYNSKEVELKSELPSLSSEMARVPGMDKGSIRFPVLTQNPTKIGANMLKDGKAAEENLNTVVAGGLNVSKLSSLNPSELFRLAAELGLAIEPVPSSSHEDLRINRYIE